MGAGEEEVIQEAYPSCSTLQTLEEALEVHQQRVDEDDLSEQVDSGQPTIVLLQIHVVHLWNLF